MTEIEPLESVLESLSSEIEELSSSFDNVTAQISSRVEDLASQTTNISLQIVEDANNEIIARADTEIANMKQLLKDFDACEATVLQLQQVKMITVSLRPVVAGLQKDLAR